MLRILFLLITISCFPACKDDGLDKPPTTNPEDTVELSDTLIIPPLQEMVVYEVNMRAFSDAGTFSGIQSRLDNIQDMGANVIWLMPIYPIGEVKTVNSPYCIRDYRAVNAEYGSLNTLKALVSAAHDRGMAVIIDWVANHTAWDHPWISAHKDWYSQDGNGNIIEPPGTGWTDVAELNYESGSMRQEMIESMLFWIDEAGIDGFRCDAIDFVPDSFWNEALASLKAHTDKDLILLGEGGVLANFEVGFEMNYAWDFKTAIARVFSEGMSAETIISTHKSEYTKVLAGGEKLRYITNHDLYAWETTPIEDFGLKGSVSAFVITSYLGGIPLIYDGQEIGHPTNISFFDKNPINWSLNPDVYDAYKDIMTARAELSAVHYGEMKSYTSKDVVAFKRFTAKQEVLVIVNVRNSLKVFDVPDELANTQWKDVLADTDKTISSSVSLEGLQYLILVRDL
ncbi:alpha-amylase family glycosyl hydrolase [Marinoscillum luteum]|uniref:Alpha-amylase family glycosyl hydrolase n=1 Tax=Marinoscillum luteum TaxID=861051 RepID=A0ABW7ND50_9BACT